MEVKSLGRNFRIVTDAELSYLLEVLNEYLPSSLKVKNRTNIILF